ncbi:hypothetical protein [Nocardia farcinica]|uniref:hypothetical protein n=1 Tax=Nocardia farcinica TaxID=37329 RepID=UPI001E3573A8|nr:hypothetical protein [Nocardia farcinica]MCZ9327528.1 hypothetical protein [Nocardia farcinica]
MGSGIDGAALRAAREAAGVSLSVPAGRRVGAGLAAAMERRVAQLRRLDDEVGSGALYPLVAGELSRAKSLVREATYGPEVGRRLFTVVAELCQLAGWVASDAGRYGEAQRTYLEGVSAADRAGARTLAAQLLSSLSYQIANVGDPADALLLAQTAVAGAEGDTGGACAAARTSRVGGGAGP